MFISTRERKKNIKKRQYNWRETRLFNLDKSSFESDWTELEAFLSQESVFHCGLQKDTRLVSLDHCVIDRLRLVHHRFFDW